MSRRLLRTLARYLAAMVFLAQLMVAAHACVLLTTGAADMQTMVAAQAERDVVMNLADAASHSDCDSIFPSDDALWSPACAEHCKSGEQTDRSGAGLQWTVAGPVLWYVHPPAQPAFQTRRALLLRVDALTATEPSHAILHCVRRT